MSRPRFLVGPAVLNESAAVLRGDEFRHLLVRRLALGAFVVLTDGLGRERTGTLGSLSRSEARIDFVDGPLENARESPLRIVLAQALLKADKLDLVIEKAAELGVAEIQLVACARSLRRQASSAQLQRWKRIAESATKQSQRSVIPIVGGPTPIEAIHTLPSTDLKLCSTASASPTSLLDSGTCRLRVHSVTVAIGPEGDFTEDELGAFRAAGFVPVHLGPRILRAETAAIVALSLVQHLWGDIAPSELQTRHG